jgi:hypothetical protein
LQALPVLSLFTALELVLVPAFVETTNGLCMQIKKRAISHCCAKYELKDVYVLVLMIYDSAVDIF